MKARWPSVVLWLAVVATAVLVVCLLHHPKTAAVAVKAPATASPAPRPMAVRKPPTSAYWIHANQVLATVNGVSITLGDLIPLTSTNPQAVQEMDPTAYHYFLQRAINRQLIMQEAQAKGIALTDGQQAQLDKLQSEREESEPGLVQKLTVNPAEIQFQLQDEQAFMLQTSLMAAQGYSPDVTPQEVQQYYQQHPDQYGPLPQDPQASQEAWQSIDYQIRETLANSVRLQYQQQLNAYMAQLTANANITITPPATQPNPQTGS